VLTLTFSQLRAHRRRLAGTVIAIMLGVAFLAGVLAFGDTLRANFSNLFTTAGAETGAVVRSATTLSTGEDAQRPLIPEALAGKIRGLPGVADAQPSITGYGEIIGANGAAIGGLGPPRTAGNWISDPALTPYRLVAGRAPQGLSEIVVNRGAAISGKLHIGEEVTVETPAPVRVRIVGLATFGTENGLGAATYAAFSLAGAEQYVTHRPGQVSSILIRPASGVSQAELVSRVKGVLPPGVEAVTGAVATQENVNGLNSSFLDTFNTFLEAFAGIALFVATFSIGSTFSILTAQRTREVALLRAVGALRRQVLSSVVTEAVMVGIVASVIGLAGGLGIAALLKGIFDSFGLALPAGGLTMSGTSVLVSLLVGIGVTVVASIFPAIRASQVPPLAALRAAAAEAISLPLRRAVTGTVLLAAGLAVVFIGLQGSGSRVMTVVSLGGLVVAIGFIVLAPVTARTATRIIGQPVVWWRGVPGTLARDNAMRNPRRTAVSATALMIGVTVVALFTVFASSLSAAVTSNVANSFVGDLAITTGSTGGGGGGSGLSPEIATAVARLPQVRTATGIGTGQANIGGQAETVTIADPSQLGEVLNLHTAAGSIGTLANSQFAISQQLANSKQWHVGSSVTVTLPDGANERLSLGAIYTSRDIVGDYLLPLGLWAPHAAQVMDKAIFIKLSPGTGVAAAEAAVSRTAATYGRVTVQDHAAYVTSASSGVSILVGLVYALLVLAIIIAMLGIANSQSLAIYERTREIGLLRAVGQTRRQLRSMIRLESLVVSMFGTLGGVILGTFLGWAIAEAGDKASGLTIFSAPPAELIIILIVGAIAGLLAAIRPVRRASRLPLLQAVAAE
jgi:putative ABC transport system permease protein